MYKYMYYENKNHKICWKYLTKYFLLLRRRPITMNEYTTSSWNIFMDFGISFSSTTKYLTINYNSCLFVDW